MSEAVAVPNFMKMTLIVSEESLARDRHTHTHTHTHRLAVTHLKLKSKDKTPHKNTTLTSKQNIVQNNQYPRFTETLGLR